MIDGESLKYYPLNLRDPVQPDKGDPIKIREPKK